jgi:GxxExxY protein
MPLNFPDSKPPRAQREEIRSEAGPASSLDAERDPLSRTVIGAAIEVHRSLGPGFLESVYEEALCHELSLRGISFERQKEIEICYKEKVIKGQRLDLVVGGAMVVEIKAVNRHEEIFTAQILSYLKGSGLTKGLLLNFGFPRMTDGIKRFISSSAEDHGEQESHRGRGDEESHRGREGHGEEEAYGKHEGDAPGTNPVV